MVCGYLFCCCQLEHVDSRDVVTNTRYQRHLLHSAASPPPSNANGVLLLRTHQHGVYFYFQAESYKGLRLYSIDRVTAFCYAIWEV